MGFFDLLKNAVRSVETQYQPMQQPIGNPSVADKRALEQHIIQQMLALPSLPFQICDCRFLDEFSAWAMFNQENVNALVPSIEKLNKLIAGCNAANQAFRLLVPHAIQIPAHKFNFGFHQNATVSNLPASYFIYQPLTKTGKQAKYPLSVCLSTSKGYQENLNDECTADLHYLKDGTLGKAGVRYFYKNRCFNYHFGIVGGSLAVTKVETPDYNTHQVAVIYDYRNDLPK